MTQLLEFEAYILNALLNEAFFRQLGRELLNMLLKPL